MLIDTHAHIDYYDNPDDIIAESLEAGVQKVIIPGVEPEKFDKIIELIDRHDCAWGCLGVHPSEADKFDNAAANRMIDLLKHPKMVAMGEMGLDYYWDKTQIDLQKSVFEKQLEIAKVLDLPVIIHDRDAHHDTLEILKKMGIKKAIMHCFSGSLEFAQLCVKEGYLIGLGGVVTFKNAKKPKEVAKHIPLESIVLETDCPFLAPHPFRGEQNAPKYLKFIAKEIANIKDISYEEVAQTTTENALKFFNLKGESNESTI